jgi:hypothetical protein
MTYNWISANTPQGRERLKELADSGACVFARHNGREGLFYNVLAKMPNTFGRKESYNLLMRLNSISRPFDWYIENGLEFLDPQPPKPQLDENGLLPCPFCGGKANGLSVPFGYFSVECPKCKFMLMEKESTELITNDWNRRAGKETGV